MTELLAPAKDVQTAISAINSGCDALYIGAQNFGARQNAGNSLEDIKEVVEHAHKFNVKVHVTVNTILNDDELKQATILINNLYDIGVDAIIVQDMGILKAAIDGKLPPIPLHMSTQCDNRTLEKVKFFDEIGVSRVILARELSLDAVKEICKNTSTEIETFVHGALCVSYSGQCYFSCANGGRSANRGECAQSCRKKYTLIDENGKIIAKDKYLLSMKDFNASKCLKNLVNAGVKSFKIEGRLKDTNYVANVVAYYRKELDKISKKDSSGEVFMDFEPDLNKSFNRGFTEYFLNGREKCFNFDTPKSLGEKLGKVTKIGKDWFEVSCSSKLNPQDGLCYFEDGDLTGCLINKVENNRIYPNKIGKIVIGTTIYRNYDVQYEKQLKNIKRKIGVKFLYNEGILHAIDEDENEVAISVLQGEKPKNPEKMIENFISQLNKTGESDFYVLDIKINGELPFLPISEINSLRRQILEMLMEERLNNYEREVQKPLKYAKFPKSEMDYRANVHNADAEKFYEKCNCKITQRSYESTKPKNVELMRTKHCLKYAFDMCKSLDKLYLLDEKNKKYELLFDCKNCEMIIKG